jgi:hypothetical protein
MSIETRSQELADLLVTRNFEPDYFKAGRSVTTAQDADMFSFDYVGASGRNYGTVVIMFQEDDTFLLLASDNMARGMEDADADAWFGFLNQLKQWAVSPGTGFRNFSIENIAKLRHHQAGMAAIREGLFEGYYGTRHISYVGEATQARLMIRHKRPLGEGDARHRQIDSLFLETADGERYRLPFRQLAGGRAMLEHVRAGGRPWDVRGVHITEMVSELAVLSRFRRASAGRVLEGISQQVVESAAHYYDALRESIRRLGSSRGYADYFESWTPADIGSHEELVEDIRQLFVEQTLDARIESALPLLARIQQKENSMKEIAVFEAWTDRMMEGTWELPETPEQKTQLRQLLSQPLTVGVDAMDATEQLGGLVGDDELFDRLTDLADRDPNANAWDDSAVMDRMWELADASPELAAALTQIGTPTGPEDDQTGMAEGLKSMYHNVVAKHHGRKADDAFDNGDEEGFKKSMDKNISHKLKAGEKIPQVRDPKKFQPGVAEGSGGDWYTMALKRHPQLKQVDREKVIDALNDAYEDYLFDYGYEGIGPDEEISLIDYAVKRLKQGVADANDQLDEIGDTPKGQAALRAVDARGTTAMDTWNKNPASGYTKAPKPTTTQFVGAMNADRRLHGFGPDASAKGRVQRQMDHEKRMQAQQQGMTEGSVQPLNIQQLATISDEALDNAYHYGRSQPGNTFGWQANLKSAEYAAKMINAGITDIEKISDAIHKGWNITAQAFVQNPEQFSDTEKLKAAGKLEAKLQQRAQLMKQNYAQLPEKEKEKDRVVARALLQALKGQQGVAESAGFDLELARLRELLGR